MLSVLSEALVESYDEKWFELGVRTRVEVVTLLVEFDVEGALRKTIDFELFNFAVAYLEAVRTFIRHKLNSVFAKMKPAAAVISDVVSVEFFV